MTLFNSFKRQDNAPFLYFEETSSTMDEAKRAIDNGQGEDLLVCADYQSRGRGRIADRKWESGRGQNLLFSRVVSPSKIKGTLPLSLQVGYGLFSFFNRYFESLPSVFHHLDFNCQIKWPNDIYLNGKKLSGVVCETYKSFYIIGIGINCNQIEFPDEIVDKATSLALELGGKREIDRVKIIEDLISILDETFQAGVESKDIEGSLLGYGTDVRYIEGDPRKNPIQYGVLEGINNDGSLRLSRGGREVSLYSGELLMNLGPKN